MEKFIIRAYTKSERALPNTRAARLRKDTKCNEKRVKTH